MSFNFIPYIFASLIFAGVMLLVVSVFISSKSYAVLGLVLSIPLSVYLFAQPLFSFGAFIPIILMIFGITKIDKGRNKYIPMMCFLPYIGISLFIFIYGIVLDRW